MSIPHTSTAQGLPRGVAALTLAGALPFVACLLATQIWPARSGMALNAFIAYSAVILSFLGGTRWGAGLLQGAGTARYAGAVLPCLLGFAALAMHFRPGWALGLLAAGFVGCWWRDRHDPAWPAGYRRLRDLITAIVVTLHAVAWALAR